MRYILSDGRSVEIRKPINQEKDVFSLIKTLSDESDNFPFNSDDFGLTPQNIGDYISYLNNRSNSVFYVAELENKIVGIGYLEGGKRTRTFHCSNLGLGILASYNNLGIGSIITNSLVEYAKNGEFIAKIDLQVRTDNRSAIKVYKKCGFLLEGKNARALFIDGEFYDYINMGLIID